jgi:hypothetical protein
MLSNEAGGALSPTTWDFPILVLYGTRVRHSASELVEWRRPSFSMYSLQEQIAVLSVWSNTSRLR